MFATLRYDVDSVQVTSTRPAHRRLKRYACKTCHSKKLRCTREQDGCRRCLSRSLRCEYERDSHRRLKTPSYNSSKDHSPIIISPAEGHVSCEAPCSQLEVPTVSATVPLTTTSNPRISADNNGVFDILDYDLSVPVSDFSAYDTTAVSNAAETPNYCGLSPRTFTGALRQEDAPPFRDQNPFLEVMPPTAITSPPLLIRPPLITGHHPTTCQCGATAISLLEAVSIEHVEVTLHSVPKVLGQGKDALNQCRDLLSCGHCSNTSEFLTLLVIICQKLLSVYQRTLSILAKQFFKLHAPRMGDDTHLAHLDAQRDAAARETERSLNMRGYDVDVEEEPCVFGGVVQMQLKKMVAFLAILQPLLVASNWSSHLMMVQLVRDKVQELLTKCSTRCVNIDCDFL